MIKGLPLDVIGAISPILCWTEGGSRRGLPEAWEQVETSTRDKAKAWLTKELPTYSQDAVMEILDAALDQRRRQKLNQPLAHKKADTFHLSPPPGYDLIYSFDHLARHFFSWNGMEIRVNRGLMVEMHELALRLPITHLVRFFHAKNVVRGYISQESALDLNAGINDLRTSFQNIRNVTERGLWEGHIHLQGVLNSNDGWAHQMLYNRVPDQGHGFSAAERRLLHLGYMAVKLMALGLIYLEIDEEDANLPYDLLLILDQLYREHRPVNGKTLREGYQDTWKKAKSDMMGVLNRLPISRKSKFVIELLDIINLEFKPHLVRLEQNRGIRGFFRTVDRLHFRVLWALTYKDEFGQDVFRWHQQGNGKPDYWQRVNPRRHFLHEVYYRYLIYNTHHWQCATHGNMSTGLRNYRMHSRSRFRNAFQDTVEAQGLTMERLAYSEPMKNLEARLSPPMRARDLLPGVVSFADLAARSRLHRFGFIFHFSKDYPDQERAVRRKAQMGFYHLRHGTIRRLTRIKAMRLFNILSQPHLVTPFIVGIDAASIELKSPPEVFAPAFRFLREYPIERNRRPTFQQRYGPSLDLADRISDRRLGMTYHVGEDFRHLLSGLRAVDEVIQFLKPVPGDRLGHAIALGLDPAMWMSQMGNQAILPKLEWLDTLVWVHNLLGPGHDLVGELGIEDTIQQLSRDVYSGNIVPSDQKYRNTGLSARDQDKWVDNNADDLQEWDRDRRRKRRELEEAANRIQPDWSIPALYDSWLLRQIDPYTVDLSNLDSPLGMILRPTAGYDIMKKRWQDIQRKAFAEVDAKVGSNNAYLLVKRYWFNESVRRRGDDLITISMEQDAEKWIQVCREVQARMKERVRERQLVVEVNPSSNRVIGPMDSLQDHHIFNLTLGDDLKLKQDLRVTVNSDDPGVFSTSLAHEYYLLAEILLEKGAAEVDVSEWLEWLRQNGKDGSFIRNFKRYEEDSGLRLYLDYIRKRYKPLLKRLKGEKLAYTPNLDHVHYKHGPISEDAHERSSHNL